LRVDWEPKLKGSSLREGFGPRLKGSSLRLDFGAGWGGVLDMLRWAVHGGDIRLMLCVWRSGVRVREDGRSRSSPSDRELMVR
jgi:hypothetical protein